MIFFDTIFPNKWYEELKPCLFTKPRASLMFWMMR